MQVLTGRALCMPMRCLADDHRFVHAFAAQTQCTHLSGRLIIMETVDVVKLLQTVLVPVLAISGLGLFILVVQTRYGSIISRIRVLNNERLDLIKKALMKEQSEFEKTWNDNRLKDIQEQMIILVKRGRLLKNSLEFIFIAVFTFIISSLLLLTEQIARIPVSLLVLTFFTLGLVMLFMTCVNLVREVRSSYNAVMLDIATNVPDEYRIKEVKL